MIFEKYLYSEVFKPLKINKYYIYIIIKFVRLKKSLFKIWAYFFLYMSKTLVFYRRKQELNLGKVSVS